MCTGGKGKGLCRVMPSRPGIRYPLSNKGSKWSSSNMPSRGWVDCMDLIKGKGK